MKRIYYLILAAATIFNLQSCQKEERINYTDTNAPAPAQISNASATSIPGGALVNYTIPADPNLLYVKAVYEIQPGVTKEAKSSIYSDTLSLMGFGDTLGHEVKLYSVGKNEKASEPVTITVNPGQPPVNTVFKTLQVSATFGGINIQFINPLRANLAIVVMIDSTGNGTLAPVTTFYTGANAGSFSVRGYPPVAKKFYVYLRDRWDNKSATIEKLLTPLAEQLLPKTSFKAYPLPTDAPAQNGLPVSAVFDNKFGFNAYASFRTQARPSWITLDMGNLAILSRLKLYSVGEHTYADGGVKTFEIWGTANAPDLNGSFDGWTLLGTFNAFKPSGQPLGTVTAEDINYGSVLGDDIDFPAGIPPVRYIRFKTLQNYGGDGLAVISELTFWGQIQ